MPMREVTCGSELTIRPVWFESTWLTGQFTLDRLRSYNGIDRWQRKSLKDAIAVLR